MIDFDKPGHSGGDGLGAFVPQSRVERAGAAEGPLKGLQFAAKDIFDIAGEVTGCGNPDWAATHAPAETDATAVARLLAAGADLVGKTITDELAYSLNGQNFHYGTPANSNAPGRIPGGSSSGSAAAVAGGVVDTALGSDTGGSIRVPASYCGLYGLRPTHGRIPLDGVMPLAPSYDTVGWFARTPGVLARVGEVLLEADRAHFAEEPETLLIAEDAFTLAAPEAITALRPWVTRLEQRIGGASRQMEVAAGFGLSELMRNFRTIQGHEIWQSHGRWITETDPAFGPEIAQRFDWVRTIDDSAAVEAWTVRRSFTERMHDLLPTGTVLVLPTAPDIAPLMNTSPDDLVQHRDRVLTLTCIAGLAGLPQISLPVASRAGCPLGLSLIAAPGADEMLLGFARGFGPGVDMEDGAEPSL